MEYWKDLTSIIKASLMSIGIVVGAIWTYLIFVRKRLSFPKLNIELNINEIKLPFNTRLIHVETRLTNIGHVILKSHYSELRLRKIVPTDDQILEAAKNDCDPVFIGKTQIEWPLVAGREWKWDHNEFEIEPSETDSLYADFIIQTDIEVVEFYFYIANAKKKKQNIGWSTTKMYKFKKEGENRMANSKETEKSNKLLNEQQRQQKQQKPQQHQEQIQQQAQQQSQQQSNGDKKK